MCNTDILPEVSSKQLARMIITCRCCYWFDYERQKCEKDFPHVPKEPTSTCYEWEISDNFLDDLENEIPGGKNEA